MKALLLSFLLVFILTGVVAQSTYFPKDHPVYYSLDRLMSNAYSDNNIHTSVKPYSRKEVMGFINNHIKDSIETSRTNQWNIKFLHKDNLALSIMEPDSLKLFKKGFLRHFYINEGDFFRLDKPNLELVINPLLNLRLGKEKGTSETIFQNTRGIEIEGLIDDKIYFYSSIYENQANFYNFINRTIEEEKTIPGQGFYKTFESGLIDNLKGYDYLNSVAYFGLPVSKSLRLELGHGNHFIGNGYHSLLLNNFANNYFYLKLDLNIWKFHYQSIFAELAAISANRNPSDELLTKKYMASHYLSFKASNNFEIGIFEAVIFAREDHFEFQYLNPVILYRTVEQFIDSPDNVLIGLNGRWNALKNISLYGQLVLDEFKIKELTAGNGWWANKYGIQLGLKYFEAFGLKSLDLLTEYNLVRPFTYGHREELVGFNDVSVANYSHYGQALAHPLGSNFHEMILKLDYRLTEKINLEGKLLYAIKGENDLMINNGGNILLPSETRTEDYGFGLADGLRKKITTVSVNASYQFFHNFYLDLSYLYRMSNSDKDLRDLNTNFIGGGMRINLANYKIDY